MKCFVPRAGEELRSTLLQGERCRWLKTPADAGFIFYFSMTSPVQAGKRIKSRLLLWLGSSITFVHQPCWISPPSDLLWFSVHPLPKKMCILCWTMANKPKGSWKRNWVCWLLYLNTSNAPTGLTIWPRSASCVVNPLKWLNCWLICSLSVALLDKQQVCPCLRVIQLQSRHSSPCPQWKW